MILQQSSPAVIPSLEEPRAVVQQLVTKFQADTDLDLILKINKAHDQIQSYRAHKLAGSRDTLHQWMKRVEAAKWEATRPADRGEARHAERMSELDRQRFALAKQIDQLELATQQLESLLVGGQKRGRLEAIKASLQDAQKPRITLPQVRLAFFRDLGFDWIDSADGGHRLRVRNLGKNDVHIVPVLDDQASLFEQANQLWQLASQ